MESRQHVGEGVRYDFEKIEIYSKIFPLFPFSFPFFLFLLLSLFFLFQSAKILRSSILWRVAEIVENKFLYKNIKNKGKKILIKSGARYPHKFIFLLYVCICTRYYVARKHRITSHGSQAKQKKDKRNNKKLLTNRKQCYIIQSSTKGKRNKKQKTQL